MSIEPVNEPLDYICRRREISSEHLANISGVIRRRVVELRRTQSAPSASEAQVIAKALRLNVDDLWCPVQVEFMRARAAKKPPEVEGVIVVKPPTKLPTPRPVIERKALRARSADPVLAGELMTAEMQRCRLTQEQLARLTKGAVHRTTINRISRGLFPTTGTRVIELICKVLSEQSGRSVTPADFGWDVSERKRARRERKPRT